MPPKKKQTNPSGSAQKSGHHGAKSRSEVESNNTGPSNNDTSENAKASTNGPPRMRKVDAASSSSNKTPRRSARSAPSTSVNALKVLQYLLSPASLEICRPKDGK